MPSLARQRTAASSSSSSAAAAAEADGSDDSRSHRIKRSSQRRKKPPLHYVPSYVVTEWTRVKTFLFVAGVILLAVVDFTPLVMLEEAPIIISENPNSLESILEKSNQVRREWVHGLGERFLRRKPHAGQRPASFPRALLNPPIPKIENYTWEPPRRGHINCDVNVDDLVYWNDPQSTADQHFRSPFTAASDNDGQERFLSFEPDLGGWNNIRMSLEILLVLAAVTGRTLVLPPKSPMNLLGRSETTYARNFGDFFPLDHPELRKHVKIITMKEFIETQGSRLLLSAVFTPEQIINKIRPSIEMCDYDAQSEHDCHKLFLQLRQHGYQPKIHAVDNCFIFDETYYKFATTKSMTAPGSKIRRFCQNRTALAYAPALTKVEWIHWQASDEKYQLLNHFYAFFFFTNPDQARFYKRLIRDFLHYSDNIYCAAGKIVHSLQQQRPQADAGGVDSVVPSFSTLHIRRGDFRYQHVRLTGEEWVENTKHIFRPGEVLYIATDERNKTFFSPFVEYGYEVRFLDDFSQVFGLSKLDRTYMGMIDSIVASHGRAFVGTWLSTFSGYVIRMRGYLGHDMKNSWYGFLPQQQAMHVPHYPKFDLLQHREWPLGWDDIDEKETIDIRLPHLKKLRAASAYVEPTMFAPPRYEPDLKEATVFTPPRREPEYIEATMFAPPRREPEYIEATMFAPPRREPEYMEATVFAPPQHRTDYMEATMFAPPKEKSPPEQVDATPLKGQTDHIEIHTPRKEIQVTANKEPQHTAPDKVLAGEHVRSPPIQAAADAQNLNSSQQGKLVGAEPQRISATALQTNEVPKQQQASSAHPKANSYNQGKFSTRLPNTATAAKLAITEPQKLLVTKTITPKHALSAEATHVKLGQPSLSHSNQKHGNSQAAKGTASIIVKAVESKAATAKHAKTTAKEPKIVTNKLAPTRLGISIPHLPAVPKASAPKNIPVSAPKGATTLKLVQPKADVPKTITTPRLARTEAAANKHVPVTDGPHKGGATTLAHAPKGEPKVLSSVKAHVTSGGAAPKVNAISVSDQGKGKGHDLAKEAVIVRGKKPSLTVSDLISSKLSDAALVRDLPLARGVAGRPMSQTPALTGARRAHIDCEINVDSLAYWNDPQGQRDRNFKSPYAVKGGPKYLTFIPDAGGWNNIRMSMETIFVFAAATGRTLVLPPEEPLYLLTGDKKDRYRGFGDFFPLHTAELQKRVPVISTEEFIRREGGPGGRLPLPEANKTSILNAVKHCEYRAKSEDSCFPLWHYLETVGRVPQVGSNYAPGKPSAYHCVVFDEDVYHGGNLKPDHKEPVSKFCGDRNLTYWTKDMEDPVLLHFKTKDGATRLLVHFYAFTLFTNPTHDHYFKRFVRDFLHYNDRIYCAAGKIVKALQIEAQGKGFPRDAGGNGGFSSLHIRRGDFQYKEVKLSAEDWYSNTKELWQPNEILYVATDERNKTFFEPLAKHHELRFLDDYWQMANLSQLDPNFMGMIDTIVASRGRVFVGTWFSTFSGYINRMRGYHGLSMNHSWYSWLPRKKAVHTWNNTDGKKYSFEWPTGWVGIDADVWPSKAVF